MLLKYVNYRSFLLKIDASENEIYITLSNVKVNYLILR